jgi:hypothetical protein
MHRSGGYPSDDAVPDAGVLESDEEEDSRFDAAVPLELLQHLVSDYCARRAAATTTPAAAVAVPQQQHESVSFASVSRAAGLKVCKRVTFSEGDGGQPSLELQPAGAADVAEHVYMLLQPAGSVQPKLLAGLEEAWHMAGVDAAEERIMLMGAELHDMLPTTDGDDDVNYRIFKDSMSAALELHPRSILLFGQYDRLACTIDMLLEQLACVQRVEWQVPDANDNAAAAVASAPFLLVTLRSSLRPVRVHLSWHPVFHSHLLDAVAEIIEAAHLTRKSTVAMTLPTTGNSRSSHCCQQRVYFSPLASVRKVASEPFVSLQVDDPDARFVLSDSAITHNCTSWFTDKSDLQLYEMLPFLDLIAASPNVIPTIAAEKAQRRWTFFGNCSVIQPNIAIPIQAQLQQQQQQQQQSQQFPQHGQQNGRNLLPPASQQQQQQQQQAQESPRRNGGAGATTDTIQVRRQQRACLLRLAGDDHFDVCIVCCSLCVSGLLCICCVVKVSVA